MFTSFKPSSLKIIINNFIPIQGCSWVQPNRQKGGLILQTTQLSIIKNNFFLFLDLSVTLLAFKVYIDLNCVLRRSDPNNICGGPNQIRNLCCVAHN